MQPQPGAEQQPQQHHVFISHVVTEKEFLCRSDQLQQAVQSQGFVSYCQKKIDASQTEFENNVWSFLKVKLVLSSFASLPAFPSYSKLVFLSKKQQGQYDLGESPDEIKENLMKSM